LAFGGFFKFGENFSRHLFGSAVLPELVFAHPAVEKGGVESHLGRAGE
jgi:hypothetical protein